MEDSSML